ncbi:MAG: ROK family protein [Myxococcota bacterium]
MTGQSLRVGVDLGGTKIEAIALADDGTEVFRERVPTPRDDYAETIEAVAALATRAGGDGFRLGVGIPGCISRKTGLVKNANSTWLNGRPLGSDLERRMGQPVRIANDANCLAVSEAQDGAAAGAKVVFAAVLGTGCGAGIAIGGEAHPGGNGLGGEWGHNPLPWLDPDEELPSRCYCGKLHCIELYVSGPGFERDYLSRHSSGSLRVRSPDIVAAARADEPLAVAALERYIARLARALASVINLLDPDVIVLGGGMSNVEELYQRVPERWSRWVFGGEVDTPLRRAVHGDSSGVRGAAWLWPRE